MSRLVRLLCLSFSLTLAITAEVYGQHEGFVPETLQRAGVPPERAKNIVDYHTTADQAGQIFTRTKPKLAVYSHICMPAATEQDLLLPTRKAYTGPLEIGDDLMVIDIGEEVSVRKPRR